MSSPAGVLWPVRACRDRGLDRPGSWLRHGGGDPNLLASRALTSYQPKIPRRSSASGGRPSLGGVREESGLRQRSSRPGHPAQGNHRQRRTTLLRTRAGVDYNAWYVASAVQFRRRQRPPGCPAPSPCRWHETSFFPRENLRAASSMRRCSRLQDRAQLTKDEILQLYINQMLPWPARLRLRCAALRVLRKPLDQLTLARSHALPGCPRRRASTPGDQR